MNTLNFLKFLKLCKETEIDNSEETEIDNFEETSMFYDFKNKMDKLYATRNLDQDKGKEYDSFRLSTQEQEPSPHPQEEDQEDQMPITLPNKPVWEKNAGLIFNTVNVGEWEFHRKVVDAGWRLLRVVDRSSHVEVIQAVNVFEELEALEEQLRELKERLKQRDAERHPFWWVAYDRRSPEEEEDEPEPMPAQIKNQPKRTEEILDEWCLKNPPKLRRQRNDELQECFDWVDKRLDWLMMTTEEEENEEKNNETFG